MSLTVLTFPPFRLVRANLNVTKGRFVELDGTVISTNSISYKYQFYAVDLRQRPNLIHKFTHFHPQKA